MRVETRSTHWWVPRIGLRRGSRDGLVWSPRFVGVVRLHYRVAVLVRRQVSSSEGVLPSGVLSLLCWYRLCGRTLLGGGGLPRVLCLWPMLIWCDVCRAFCVGECEPAVFEGHDCGWLGFRVLGSAGFLAHWLVSHWVHLRTRMSCFRDRPPGGPPLASPVFSR